MKLSSNFHSVFFQLVLFSTFLPEIIYCQNESGVLEGTVREAGSHSPLPSVNVRVNGTTVGTATNSEGKYRLILPHGKHTIIASCVGFYSDTVLIDVWKQEAVHDFDLKIRNVELGEMTIFGDDPNPAEEIIRRAITKKHAVLSQLHSYEFRAYTKTVMRVLNEKENGTDTLIGGILESQTRGYWEAPDSYKEIIDSRKQTANFQDQMNIFTVGRLPNLNDDMVLVNDKHAVGPTAPDAFEYYSFQMLDTTSLDNIAVWRIRITPKSQNIPLFDGIISIADGSFLVVSIDVKGNEALNSSPFDNISLRQHFLLIDDDFWLPSQSYQSGDITISFGFASITMNVQRSSILSQYKINTKVPEGIFDDRNLLSVVPESVQDDSIGTELKQALPLNREEAEAYRKIDSIMSAPNLLQSIAMAFTKAPITLRELPITGVNDFFHFNRVEGSYLGAGLRFDESMLTDVRFRVRAGYGVADKGWKYGIEAERSLTQNGKLSIGGAWYRKLQYREEHPFSWNVFDTGINTLLCLLDKNDPVDYYRASGYSLFLRVMPFSSLALKFQFIDEQQSSVVQHSHYSMFSRDRRYRPNPPILDGRMRSAILDLAYDTRQFVDAGWFEAVDETQDSWTIRFQSEYTDPKLLKSDYNYTRYALDCSRRVHTFGSTMLKVHSSLGYALDNLPPQRLFDLNSGTSGLSQFGMFKTATVKEFAGDAFATLFIDYNLGSMVFRALNLPYIRNLDLILYSGTGWSGMSNGSRTLQTISVTPAKRIFYEAGFGIGRIFTFFRFDCTWRLTHRDGNNFAFTLESSLE